MVTAAESEGLATINPPAEGFSPNPTQGEWGKIEGQRRLGGNDKLKVCTFNIQFLGNYKNRDNHALADYMKKSSCDMVVVQELIAPPNIATLYSAQPEMANKVYTFPDHTPIVPNEGNTDFFKEMRMAGFDKFWLSDQDTGNSETNQSNGTATEWFVVFYKNWLVSPKLSLPHGFLHSDVTHNPRFDRVPYAFSFQTKG
ncbi:MAG: hypothetical protein K2P92_05370, partial [Bdellovibrionaceae bacterium]|nr:hypothetical protein [Pseudobdellovibrionaceae bacterium]